MFNIVFYFCLGILFLCILVLLAEWPKAMRKKSAADHFIGNLQASIESGSLCRDWSETGLHGTYKGRRAGATTRKLGNMVSPVSMGIFIECKYLTTFTIVKDTALILAVTLRRIESMTKINYRNRWYHTNNQAVAEAVLTKSSDLVNQLFDQLKCNAIGARPEKKFVSRSFFSSKSANYPPGLWAVVNTDALADGLPQASEILETLYEIAVAVESVH